MTRISKYHGSVLYASGRLIYEYFYISYGCFHWLMWCSLDDRGFSQHYICMFCKHPKALSIIPFNTKTSVRNSTVENLLLLKGVTTKYIIIFMHVPIERNKCYYNLIIQNWTWLNTFQERGFLTIVLTFILHVKNSFSKEKKIVLECH